MCAVLLVVVVFDPAKYQCGWEVSLGGVLASGLAKSLGLPSSGVPVFIRRVIGTLLAFGLVRAIVRIPTWTPGQVSRIRQCDPVAWATASHCDSLHVHDEPIVNNGPTQSAETLS
jgi:hypothetical protein